MKTWGGERVARRGAEVLVLEVVVDGAGDRSKAAAAAVVSAAAAVVSVAAVAHPANEKVEITITATSTKNIDDNIFFNYPPPKI